MRDNRLKVVPLFISIKSALFVDTHIKMMTQSMKMAVFMDMLAKMVTKFMKMAVFMDLCGEMDTKQKHLLIMRRCMKFSGSRGSRTPDPLLVRQML